MTLQASQFFCDKLCDDDIALRFVDEVKFAHSTDEATQNFAKMSGFTAKAGQVLLSPAESATDRFAYVGVGADAPHYSFGGSLAQNLPKGNSYYIDAAELNESELYNIALGWGMEQFASSDYKSDKAPKPAILVFPKIDKDKLLAELQAVFLIRHLVNLPANDMNPESLHAQAEALAKAHKCQFKAIVGNDLLKQNFPLIHAVGRASVYEPRLLEITHSPKDAKLSLTLVGKGVCFDSGGLDIKPSSGMLIMKKDMGGAAHVLGLAQMILQTGLPIRLRVLVAAVENAISADAFRPMDIITSRSGKSVEVGNTDAEGRLILADALTYACEDDTPDVLIDFATLTGAARVAVGTEIAAMFASQAETAAAVMEQSATTHDAVWQLPLHSGYRNLLTSNMADISSTGASGYAGAITAALFLKDFVLDDVNWLHFDIMAWNLRSRPAHPIGGEAMGIRAVYYYLQKLTKG